MGIKWQVILSKQAKKDAKKIASSGLKPQAQALLEILQNNPFGSILLWRTRSELRIERNLGPYELPKNDPEYPIDYVLDGQQRITSIFGIFQNSLVAQENQDINWTNLFFELDIVVLTSFFASSQKQPSPVPQEKNEVIKKWFWRSCFSKRYARGGAKNTDLDIEEMQKLKNNESNKLGEFDYSINEEYFIANCLIMSAIATKTFILMVACEHPLNFIQGTEISLEKVLSIGNRKEFHHIYPKDYLEKSNHSYTKEQINCLANFTILSRADNNKIKNKPPSKYKSLMPQEQEKLENILKTHLCNMDIFNDDYDNFLKARMNLLIDKAKELCS